MRDHYQDSAVAQRERIIVPATITFYLMPLTTKLARCFFCREPGCDQTFIARSKDQAKTKAYAAHNRCVLEHMKLQSE